MAKEITKKIIKKLNQDLPEGATPLAQDELEDLKPKFITTRKDLFDAEFKNINKAYQKYFLAGRRVNLKLAALMKVHQEMFGQVWKWAGIKRKTNKNIGVDKNQIDSEIKKLLDDLEFWEKDKMDLIERSARLHHRLVFIHPFSNGNGRWARLISSIYLYQINGQYLNFPEDQLLLMTGFREQYIKALKEADRSHYQSLIDLYKKFIK
jgi:Fic-DOC domain mobile mystery protein B